MHPMLKGRKALLFDLDGTLVDSMWMWKDIDQEYLAQFGHSLPDTLQEEISGMSFTETAVYFKQKFDIPDSLREIQDSWNRMAMEKYRSQVPLKPGCRVFLDWAKGQGLPMAIGTSNSRELSMAVLEAHGLESYFGALITSCDVKAGKPAPDVYLACAQALGAEPADCLVFEDIMQGIEAARAARMRVCAVADPFSAAAWEEKKQLSDYWIEDYRELFV